VQKDALRQPVETALAAPAPSAASGIACGNFQVFRDAWDRAQRRIESRYAVSVSVCEVTEPYTGDFDGKTILVDKDQDLEMALFVLIHLFGHTVQWNLSPALRRLGQSAAATAAAEVERSAEWMCQVRDYERDATRYSLALLHDVGIFHLDRWVSEFWHADWAFLEHFYRTGEKLDVRSLLRPGEGEVLTPLPIPDFTPQRFVSRWSF